MKDTEQTTLAEFIRCYLLGMECKQAARNPYINDASMTHWTCILRAPGGRVLKTTFSQGSAYRGAEPELESVLNCLMLDARSTESTFEDWCAELGYDEDSRSAERTYNACREIAGKLRAFLTPEQFAQLMACESL